MLKNKCKSLVVLLLTMMIIATTRISMAADYSCKVSLLGNKLEVKKGESVTILVKASEIQAGEGVAGFFAMLVYDTNAFDCTISGDDEGNWQQQQAIENSIAMTRSDLLPNSNDQTVAKIVLTAKSDAAAGEQTFKLTNVGFSTGTETFSVGDVSATITITDDSGDNSSNNNIENNTNTNANTNSNSMNTNINIDANTLNAIGMLGNNSLSSNSTTNTSAKNTSTINNSVSSDNSIPKTGISDILMIGAVIGVIVAIIAYIKYKRTYE